LIVYAFVTLSDFLYGGTFDISL